MSLKKNLLFSFLILSAINIKCDENYYLSEEDVENLANQYALSEESIKQVKLLQKIKNIEAAKIIKWQDKNDANAYISLASGAVIYYIIGRLLSSKTEDPFLIQVLSVSASFSLASIIFNKLSRVE